MTQQYAYFELLDDENKGKIARVCGPEHYVYNVNQKNGNGKELWTI